MTRKENGVASTSWARKNQLPNGPSLQKLMVKITFEKLRKECGVQKKDAMSLVQKLLL